MVTKKNKRSAVKIDENLLERVNNLVRNRDKRIKYSTAKQFVNIAVLKLLEEEEK